VNFCLLLALLSISDRRHGFTGHHGVAATLWNEHLSWYPAEFCYVQSLSPLDTVISRSFGGVVLYTHWLCSQKACGQLGACVLSFIVLLKP
jgi:hypothetical protein